MQSTKPTIQTFMRMLLSDARANWGYTAICALYSIYYGRLAKLGTQATVTADQVRREWTEYNCYNAALSDLGNLDKRWFYTLPNGHVIVRVGN